MSAGPLMEASAGALRALATAMRNGQLGPAITRMALGRVAQCPESITKELCRLFGPCRWFDGLHQVAA